MKNASLLMIVSSLTFGSMTCFSNTSSGSRLYTEQEDEEEILHQAKKNSLKKDRVIKSKIADIIEELEDISEELLADIETEEKIATIEVVEQKLDLLKAEAHENSASRASEEKIDELQRALNNIKEGFIGLKNKVREKWVETRDSFDEKWQEMQHDLGKKIKEVGEDLEKKVNKKKAEL